MNPKSNDLNRRLIGGITKNDKLDLYEKKSIDLVFPEFNTFFKSKYGTVYMNILREFGSANTIAHADIRTIRKCFDMTGRGQRISLTAEKLKESAHKSIGIDSFAEEMQIKHLVSQIELINKQIKEIDKKIEEFSVQNNSPILSIPGISHFSGTSILAELGNICNSFSLFFSLFKI